jgi:hypothetical protein
VVALARKLAGVLWAMWRDGTVYDRAWQAQQTARGVNEAARQQTHRAQALQQSAKKLQRGSVRAAAKTERGPSKRRQRGAEAAQD